MCHKHTEAVQRVIRKSQLQQRPFLIAARPRASETSTAMEPSFTWNKAKCPDSISAFWPILGSLLLSLLNNYPNNYTKKRHCFSCLLSSCIYFMDLQFYPDNCLCFIVYKVWIKPRWASIRHFMFTARLQTHYHAAEITNSLLEPQFAILYNHAPLKKINEPDFDHKSGTASYNNTYHAKV